MHYESYINDALDIASAWEIPEEDFAQVVNDQARRMACMYMETSSDLPFCSPYEALKF